MLLSISYMMRMDDIKQLYMHMVLDHRMPPLETLHLTPCQFVRPGQGKDSFVMQLFANQLLDPGMQQ